MSKTGRLSPKEIGCTLSPSFVLRTCSQAKTCWLKKNCICSLAMLMHSCSKEFFCRSSKPKMSNRATDKGRPLRRKSRIIRWRHSSHMAMRPSDRCRLVWFTIQSKSLA
ncbi:unnamed protein product [Ixodes pacificus]